MSNWLWEASLSCSWPCPTFLSLSVYLARTLEGPRSSHRSALVCLPRIQLDGKTPKLAQLPSAADVPVHVLVPYSPPRLPDGSPLVSLLGEDLDPATSVVWT